MSTLKREEIHVHAYRDVGELMVHVREFIDHYYNPQRLHSALGLSFSGRIRTRCEESHLSEVIVAASDSSFLRHEEIYRSDAP